VLFGADAAYPLERGAERECAAVADVAGDGSDGRVGVAQQVGGERQPPAGEEGHGGLADQLGEPAGQGGSRDAGLGGERGDGAADTVAAFVDRAVASDVGRLVLLSGRNEDGALLAEHAVQQSGAAWTIVRSSFFAQNFSESFFLDAVRSGVVAFPAENVAEPFVDADDVADVAVAALIDDTHDGQLYEVTGPRLLTFGEAVRTIAEASGTNVDYLPVSGEDYAAALRAEGLDAAYVADLTELFTTVLDGRSAYVADGVQRALGRGPRDFADYARSAAATGVWNPQVDLVAG